TSADGFIARPDGDVGWLDRPWPKGEYGMPEFYASIDTVLMGRKTWEVGRKLGPASYAGKKNYVFSRAPQEEMENITFISEPPAAFVGRLRAESGGGIWVIGGAELIAELLDGQVIDEFMIHVVPVIIGEGIPLIAPRQRNVELALASTKAFDDGVVLLHYRVTA
ncbi:MAG: bifunctional deaminase-reductase domain protein, partial [Acidobacteria bacterium]|nr:bifunctional deaminase-reductase domain protein [Acidobacteriota bacterium]